MSDRVESFAPRVHPGARVLILGSMPGVASLRAGHYYAHPRNRFWPWVGEALGFDPALPWEERYDALRTRGVGLWDVLGACERRSSLDADIVSSTMEPNDMRGLVARVPSLETVLLNGQKAGDVWTRRIARAERAVAALRVHVLPSTSPANASIPEEVKRSAWVRALAEALDAA